MISWYDYVMATDETAIYPDANQATATEFAYIGLGIQGELGELFYLMGGNDFNQGDMGRAISEIGDCFWYTARGWRALTAHGIDFSEFQTPGLVPMNAAVIAALSIGNETKKLLRGDAEPGSEKHTFLVRRLAEHYALLRVFLEETCQRLSLLQVAPSYVMETNLKKLRQRKALGTLTGSGDSR